MTRSVAAAGCAALSTAVLTIALAAGPERARALSNSAPDCRASTALSKRPHELRFRVPRG